MFKWFSAFIRSVRQKRDERHARQLALMRRQAEALRRLLPEEELILTDEERRKLLALGAKLNHEIDDILTIISPETYRRWVREDAESKKSGAKNNRRSPMFKKLSTFVFLLIHSYHARRDHQLAMKSKEIKMLRHRLGNKRIVPSPDERRELIAIGAKFDHQVDGLIEVVAPDTYRHWLRDAGRGKEPRKVGRKPSEGELVDLVLKMRQNPGWGYVRIVGELAKLGIHTNHMTVKAILERESKEPNPDGSSTRKKPIIPWNQWIEMHMDSLLA